MHNPPEKLLRWLVPPFKLDSIMESYYLRLDRLLFYIDDNSRRRLIIRNGTPYFRYDFGPEYNPLAHALVALAYYQRGKLREFLYYTENLAKRASFINFRNGMRVALWYYDFAFPLGRRSPAGLVAWPRGS